MEGPLPFQQLIAHQIIHADADGPEPEINPVLVPSHDKVWSWSPMFSRGFEDCAQEAVRYLVEDEGLAVEDPVIVGLLQHLRSCFFSATSMSWDLPYQESVTCDASATSAVDHFLSCKVPTDQLTSTHFPGCGTSPSTSPEATAGILVEMATRSNDASTTRSKATVTSCEDAATLQSTKHSCLPGKALSPEKRSAGSPPFVTASPSDLEGIVTVSPSDLAGILSCLHYLHPLSPPLPCGTKGGVSRTSSVSDSICEDCTDSSTDRANVCLNAHADVREGIMEDSHVNMTTVTHLSPVYQTSALSETSPAMSPLVGLPASMLTPEEIKIRMLAHEILSLLEEEVLDGPTVLDEIDGMSDDADSDMEMDVQDTVVEVEP